MLCPSCRRQLSRTGSFCGHCGTSRPGVGAPLELVLPDGTRVPVVGEMTIGRAPGSTLQVEDPTVSRTHVRIAAGSGGGAVLEDAGSSAGTFIDDAQVDGPVSLQDGTRIRLGTLNIGVERQRDASEAGRTIVVRPGASLMISAVSAAPAQNGTSFGLKPRLRSGYALKKLEESEGSRRWVLRDLRTDKFLRFSDRDAEILQMLDGTNTLVDLIGGAEQRFGATGSARVARLLADLSERGFLAGVASEEAQHEAPKGFFRKLVGPREKSWSGVARLFERTYERGGWALFTRPALIAIAVIAVAGIGAFGYLIAGRYGTPFVVAQRIGLGALIFLLGRFAFVAFHEMAHGLTMASYGRRIDRAGAKLVFIFPYAFVDTSEAWFEPRRHRIAISAAGPISDFTIGGIFSLCSLLVDGTLRDVFFQLAFAAYVGGIFNLNPFLDRDGYHMLVDTMNEPGLRKRAKDQFERRITGRSRDSDSQALARYSIAGLGWAFASGAFAIFMSLRYEPILVRVVGSEIVVHVVMYTLWVAVFIPVFIAVGKPLIKRFRGSPE